jgi:hypothetical protein
MTGIRPAHSSDTPVLITDAPLSYAEELRIRKRRYALTMGLRIPLMIAAVAAASIPWLAVALLVASIPLPWMAVLIANDRLPRRAEDAHRYRRGRTALEDRSHPTIEAAETVPQPRE